MRRHVDNVQPNMAAPCWRISSSAVVHPYTGPLRLPAASGTGTRERGTHLTLRVRVRR